MKSISPEGGGTKKLNKRGKFCSLGMEKKKGGKVGTGDSLEKGGGCFFWLGCVGGKKTKNSGKEKNSFSKDRPVGGKREGGEMGNLTIPKQEKKESPPAKGKRGGRVFFCLYKILHKKSMGEKKKGAGQPNLGEKGKKKKGGNITRGGGGGKGFRWFFSGKRDWKEKERGK